MGKVSIAAYSRYLAMGAACALYLGGAAGCFYADMSIGIYGIVVGVVIHGFEYPIPIVKYFGPINDILWIRGILYILLSGAACIIVPTTAGGFFIFIAGWSYIWAAIRGEKWKDPLASGGGGGEGGGERSGGGGGGGGKGGGDKPAGGDKGGGGGGDRGGGGDKGKGKGDKKNAKYDAQGYAIEDAVHSAPANLNYTPVSIPANSGYGGYDASGYDASGYDSRPPPVSSKPKPGPKPKVPLPPSAAASSAGYDASGYDASGYDETGYDAGGYK